MTYFDLVALVVSNSKDNTGRVTYSNRYHRYFDVHLPESAYKTLTDELEEEAHQHGYKWIADEYGYIVRIIGIGFAYVYCAGKDVFVKERHQKPKDFDTSFIDEDVEELEEAHETTTP